MRFRFLVGLALLVLVVAACDSGDAELTPGSTLITGGGGEGVTSTSDASGSEATTPVTPTTLVGQPVGDGFEVVATFPNDNGEAQHIVIAEGAYTDVDLENFVFTLLEANPNLYGAEIFDDAGAAAAFVVPEDSRSDAQNALLERHHFVTLVGRDSYEFRGPFSEFPGGAIGS